MGLIIDREETKKPHLRDALFNSTLDLFSNWGGLPLQLDPPWGNIFVKAFSPIFNSKHNHNYETGPKNDKRDQYSKETRPPKDIIQLSTGARIRPL